MFYEDLGAIAQRARPGGGLRPDRRADQGAQARRHRHRQLQGAVRVRRRERLPPLPPRPRRPPERVSGELLLDRRVRRGRHRRRAGVRRRRRDHRALPPPGPGDRETRILQVLKLRGSGFRRASTPTASPRTGSTSSRGSPTPSRTTTTPSATPGLHGHRGARRAAGRRLLARRRDAQRRPVRVREDPHGPALHLQRRRDGEPGVSPASRRTRRSSSASSAASAGRLTTRHRAHVPLAGRPLHRRVGLRPARHGRARRCPARPHRQPRRPPVRGAGPIRFREYMYSLSQRSHAGASACS